MTCTRLLLPLLLAVVVTSVVAEKRYGRLTVDEKQRQPDAEIKGRITFDKYLTYDEVSAYLDDVGKNHPDIAKVQVLGKSFEGRDIKGIKLSKGGSGKPSVFVDGAIQSRDWIASAVALYLIQQLTEGDMTGQLDSVDWVVLPLVNPDGYEYSRLENRKWLKTRSTVPNNTCKGVDVNCNFDFHWMDSGASSTPCDIDFAGMKAFSESETRALRDFISANNATAKAYLSLQSYGKYLLYPWGYDTSKPTDWQDLDKLAYAMRDAIKKVRGTVYAVGSFGSFLYTTSGSSMDWSKGVANIKYAYSFRLPAGGASGYDVPPSEILPISQETMEGLKVVAAQVAGM